MVRAPAVAGRFYPDEPKALLEEIKEHLPQPGGKVRAMGVVAPHAGIMYSGDVAGSVYSKIEVPESVVIVGPNHTGYGEPISLMAKGSWAMPMGKVEIDEELAREILKASPSIREDDKAHLREHSIEVQIPFLQYFRKDFKFVPICLMRTGYEVCREVGGAIAAAIERLDRKSVLVVASSDMTHYESHESASQKDRLAIDKILKLDDLGLYQTVRDRDISMCGANPVTVMLACCKDRGARDCELVRYMTSGEVSGDMDQVVGYAGLIVK
ncbi:MAG: AmmeMemoRadiSam system protein B [Nitrospinae bacterium]|nr:AmmeMemoRadiSam system protein B [Nitrospinota bacterium]